MPQIRKNEQYLPIEINLPNWSLMVFSMLRSSDEAAADKINATRCVTTSVCALVLSHHQRPVDCLQKLHVEFSSPSQTGWSRPAALRKNLPNPIYRVYCYI
jgi:hypothetical protein